MRNTLGTRKSRRSIFLSILASSATRSTCVVIRCESLLEESRGEHPDQPTGTRKNFIICSTGNIAANKSKVTMLAGSLKTNFSLSRSRKFEAKKKRPLISSNFITQPDITPDSTNDLYLSILFLHAI